MNEFCVCGHTFNYHVDHTDVGIGKYCVGQLNPDCHCSTFKLDNLKLIEDLARKRNLV